MKYENLMDIPWGYEMQLAEGHDYGYHHHYPVGTKVTRGHVKADDDDDSSVSFTFPDGAWDYLYKQQIQDIPEEKKGVKGSDKVMVELTGYQVAQLFVLLGSCSGDEKYESDPDLYLKLRHILGKDINFHSSLHDFMKAKDFPTYLNFSAIEEHLYDAILEPETPALTAAQKKANELKETIAKAQKQLEELESELK